jgi:hypothetical protein
LKDLAPFSSEDGRSRDDRGATSLIVGGGSVTIWAILSEAGTVPVAIGAALVVIGIAWWVRYRED